MRFGQIQSLEGCHKYPYRSITRSSAATRGLLQSHQSTAAACPTQSPCPVTGKLEPGLVSKFTAALLSRRFIPPHRHFRLDRRVESLPNGSWPAVSCAKYYRCRIWELYTKLPEGSLDTIPSRTRQGGFTNSRGCSHRLRSGYLTVTATASEQLLPVLDSPGTGSTHAP